VVFSLLQVDSAESLLVECSGVPDGSLLSGSIIRPNQFRSLPNLRNAARHCMTACFLMGDVKFFCEFGGKKFIEEQVIATEDGDYNILFYL
jgi:hypothetical protein